MSRHYVTNGEITRRDERLIDRGAASGGERLGMRVWRRAIGDGQLAMVRQEGRGFNLATTAGEVRMVGG